MFGEFFCHGLVGGSRIQMQHIYLTKLQTYKLRAGNRTQGQNNQHQCYNINNSPRQGWNTGLKYRGKQARQDNKGAWLMG